MSGRVEGKVAFITGAARGQGRAHALRLAEEGADIIALDLCEDFPGMPYKGSTQEDLAETVRAVEHFDRRIVAVQADVRDAEAVRAGLGDAVGQLGHVDIVSATAGIAFVPARVHEISEQTWQDMIDVNLTGVWHTIAPRFPTCSSRSPVPSWSRRRRRGSARSRTWRTTSRRRPGCSAW